MGRASLVTGREEASSDYPVEEPPPVSLGALSSPASMKRKTPQTSLPRCETWERESKKQPLLHHSYL